MKVLLVDNFDSFTYNLFDYISQIGVQCGVFRNDEISIDEIEKKNFDAIVISPGPKTPNEAGVTKEIVKHFHQKIPVLGICLGFHAIGEFFGAKLEKAAFPVHGKTSPIKHNGHPLFSKIPQEFDGMRYHSLVLRDLKKTPLQVLAKTSDGIPMAFQHPKFPVTGFQFHPESVLTNYGLQLLKNWFKTNCS